MIIAVALFAFVFVALSVAGCRAIDVLKRQDAEIAHKAAIRANAYTGPLYNRHGRAIG